MTNEKIDNYLKAADMCIKLAACGDVESFSKASAFIQKARDTLSSAVEPTAKLRQHDPDRSCSKCGCHWDRISIGTGGYVEAACECGFKWDLGVLATHAPLPEKSSACQHDLLKPNHTILIDLEGSVQVAECSVCKHRWLGIDTAERT